jgi:DNA-binding PadR family transcriptional regulator
MELESHKIIKRVQVTDRDREAILFVAQQGFATIDQLWRVIWREQKSSVYTRSRLLSLEKAQFLTSLRVSEFPQKIFRATPKGKHLVASRCQHIIPMGDLSSVMAAHQLELNEVRIILQARGVKSWRSAESLIIDPSFKKLGGKHVPDGLYVTSKGIRTAVEYDRTMRKKERIKERMSSYVSELYSPDRSFDRLIYLVTPMLERAYEPLFAQGFSSMRNRAILMTLPNFIKAFKESEHE